MELIPEQIRAARALLNWKQSDLAERTELATPSIANIELGKHRPNPQTREKIIRALSQGGVELIEGGARLKRDRIRIIEGDDWYLRLLDDVFVSVQRSERKDFWVLFGKDSLSPREVNDSYRRIRELDVQMRQLVEEDDTWLMGPLDEYRYIPKDHFENYVSLIYADKVAICADDNTRAVVIEDEHLARTWRRTFGLMWSLLKKPKRSDARERF